MALQVVNRCWLLVVFASRSPQIFLSLWLDRKQRKEKNCPSSQPV